MKVCFQCQNCTEIFFSVYVEKKISQRIRAAAFVFVIITFYVLMLPDSVYLLMRPFSFHVLLTLIYTRGQVYCTYIHNVFFWHTERLYLYLHTGAQVILLYESALKCLHIDKCRSKAVFHHVYC